MNIIRFTNQLKLAINSLTQAKGFSASIILTLSLTLACFFVVMSLFSSYFIKPLKVENESRLVIVEQDNIYADKNSPGYQSFQAIDHWYNSQQVFEKAAAVSTSQRIIKSLPGQPKIDVTYATSEYYELFKVPLVLGRHIAPAVTFEEQVQEMLISYAFWQRYFDGDESVIGQSLQVEGLQVKSFKVVGVVAKEFVDPFMFNGGKAQVWFNFSSDARYFREENRSPWSSLYSSLKLVGVLKHGETHDSTVTHLYQSIQQIKTQWKEGFPSLIDLKPIVTSFREAELGDNDNLAILLLAGVTGLLSIALLNVSNLFITRAVVKHKQLALQAVLGAKLRVLFQSILLETSVLMIASVLVALFIAAWGIQLFVSVSDGFLPLISDLSLDMTVLCSALVTCFLLSFLFAFITSRLINFTKLRMQIQSSGKGAVSQVNPYTIKLMIGFQLFLATVLVISATMVLNKSLETLNRPLGSETENLFTVQLFIQNMEESISERYHYIDAFKEALRNIDGVERVAHGDSPVQMHVRSTTVTDMSGKESLFIPQAWVGRDYFDVTGLKIIEGRTFSDAAIRGEKHEFLVSKAVNDLLKPGGSLVGESFISFDPDNPVEVVGITENFNHPKSFGRHQGRQFWFVAQPYSFPYIVKMEEGKSLSRELVFQAGRTVDPRTGVWLLTDMHHEYGMMTHMERMTRNLSIVLAMFTLLLAGIGIYGVLSYNLGLRRYELGIRMALGAKSKTLYKQLFKDTILPLASSFILAVLVCISSYSKLTEHVNDYMLLNATWLTAVCMGIVLFALFATLYPMSKILGSKPMASLRQE
ncbi:ABC transporter permease [Pseudoalteromonas luteoviolacea]|uniref:ABC transporter permease n=1 Tax=Pseudoalteromonas luteoviolacea TaxID=43657 RepID=UPI001F176170|nr:ABC transporter permease [Pseudoalteromonas luteoviolacea]MCF6443010.1 ABC transporter permease [Pseudoalteromonas luteoviolacea]